MNDPVAPFEKPAVTASVKVPSGFNVTVPAEPADTVCGPVDPVVATQGLDALWTPTSFSSTLPENLVALCGTMKLSAAADAVENALSTPPVVWPAPVPAAPPLTTRYASIPLSRLVELADRLNSRSNTA